MMTGPDIGANVDTQVAYDSTSSTNETTISYPNNWIRQTFLARNHSRRQRNV
jgi:hypothetical protein